MKSDASKPVKQSRNTCSVHRRIASRRVSILRSTRYCDSGVWQLPSFTLSGPPPLDDACPHPFLPNGPSVQSIHIADRRNNIFGSFLLLCLSLLWLVACSNLPKGGAASVNCCLVSLSSVAASSKHHQSIELKCFTFDYGSGLLVCSRIHEMSGGSIFAQLPPRALQFAADRVRGNV